MSEEIILELTERESLYFALAAYTIAIAQIEEALARSQPEKAKETIEELNKMVAPFHGLINNIWFSTESPAEDVLVEAIKKTKKRIQEREGN